MSGHLQHALGRRVGLGGLGWAALWLAGCANAPQSLYLPGPYQPLVYQHFKAEGSPLEQFSALEKHRVEAAKQNRTLPPGYLAHMGLLQYKLGQHEAAVSLLKAEKAAFPESGAYLDDLIAKMAKTER